MVQWVVRSILHDGPIELFLTSVTKAVVCAILCGMMYIKEPLLLIRKSSLCCGSRFPLSLNGPLPYVRHHITVNKMC